MKPAVSGFGYNYSNRRELSFAQAGLKPGDQWCLCAARFLQAHEEGAAPQVRLHATHIRTLDIVPLSILKDYAVDLTA